MTVKEKSVLQLKIQTKIEHLLLEMFSKSEMSFGDKKFSITITNVDISPDFKNLKIFIEVSNIDKKQKEEVLKNLNTKNIYTIKKLLAEKINLRYVPEVIFILDNSNEKLFKMNKIIENEKKKFKYES